MRAEQAILKKGNKTWHSQQGDEASAGYKRRQMPLEMRGPCTSPDHVRGFLRAQLVSPVVMGKPCSRVAGRRSLSLSRVSSSEVPEGHSRRAEWGSQLVSWDGCSGVVEVWGL